MADTKNKIRIIIKEKVEQGDSKWGVFAVSSVRGALVT